MSDLFIVLAIGALIGLILFLFGKYVELANSYYKKKKNKDDPDGKKPQKQNGPPSKTYCPLCDSALTPGINLFSKVYRPLTSEIDDDQRCTIQGCPFCYSKDGEKKNGAVVPYAADLFPWKVLWWPE